MAGQGTGAERGGAGRKGDRDVPTTSTSRTGWPSRWIAAAGSAKWKASAQVAVPSTSGLAAVRKRLPPTLQRM